jgi:hypothetical protein
MARTQQPPARAIERTEAPRPHRARTGSMRGQLLGRMRRAGAPGRRADASRAPLGCQRLQSTGGVRARFRHSIYLINAGQGQGRARPGRHQSPTRALEIG